MSVRRIVGIQLLVLALCVVASSAQAQTSSESYSKFVGANPFEPPTLIPGNQIPSCIPLGIDTICPHDFAIRCDGRIIGDPECDGYEACLQASLRLSLHLENYKRRCLNPDSTLCQRKNAYENCVELAELLLCFDDAESVEEFCAERESNYQRQRDDCASRYDSIQVQIRELDYACAPSERAWRTIGINPKDFPRFNFDSTLDRCDPTALPPIEIIACQ